MNVDGSPTDGDGGNGTDAPEVVTLPWNGLWVVIAAPVIVVVMVILLGADWIRTWPDMVRDLATLALSLYALWEAGLSPRRKLKPNKFHRRSVWQWLAIALGILGLALTVAQIPSFPLLS